MNRERKAIGDRISEYIQDKLKDWLENIKFNFSFTNSYFIFFVKDVQIRKDLLKRLGIPLELSNGRVQEIKLKVIITNLIIIYNIKHLILN